MHKVLVSLTLAAALSLTSGAASAMTMTATKTAAPAAKTAPAKPATSAAKTTTGQVFLVSTKYCTVQLANRGVFVFAKGCDLSKIKVGDWVTITWTQSGTIHAATKIEASTAKAGMDMMMGMMKH